MRIATNAANYLQLYVDEERIWDVETFQAWEEAPGKSIKYSAAIPSGKHIVTWVFHKERQYSWMDEDDVATTADGGEDRVQLTSIVVSGVKEGGAQECLKCPSGYIANSASSLCDACKPGMYAEEGSGTCATCPKGTFSGGWGSTRCQRCGHGTFSPEGASACE